MRVVLKLLLAAAFAVAVAACAGTATRVGTSGISEFYSPSLASYVSRNGTFPMEVHGNPFGVPQAQSDAAIRGARAIPAWAGTGNFVAHSEPGRGLRLVLVFGPTDAAVGSRRVCSDAGEIATARSETQTHVFAAFCRNNEWITYASIRVPALKGPDDPALNDLMG